MSNWMWRTLGEEFGPVPIAELLDLAANGTIGPDDEVRRCGSDKWQAVATVPELRKLSNPNPNNAAAIAKNTQEVTTTSPVAPPVAAIKSTFSPLDAKPIATNALAATHQAASPRSAHPPVVATQVVQSTNRAWTAPQTPATRRVAWVPLGLILMCLLIALSVRYYIVRPLIIPLVYHKHPIDCIAFSPDGRWIATGGDDNSLCLWSARDGVLHRTIQGHQGHIMTVAFSPDSERVITGSQDNTAKVWDVESGIEVFNLAGHEKRVDGAAFSPDGILIATGAWDKTVRIWEASSGNLLRKFDTQLVNCLCFSPDGQTIATCSWDWTVRTYDVTTGKQKRTFVGHGNGVYSVAFRHDGQQLVSASEDGTIRVWNVETSKQVLRLEGHAGPVYKAHFTPDGNQVVSCGKDRTVKVWNLDTAMELKTLDRHPADVRCVACSPDGRTIASGGGGAVAFLWKRYLP